MDLERTVRKRIHDLLTRLGFEWWPTGQQVLWAIRIAVVAVVLLGVLLFLYVVSVTFDKPIWGTLKVLAVPITLGAAVPLLNWLQKKRELHVESQRAQDEALQAYLDQLTELLWDKQGNRVVRMSVDNGVPQIIQARTEALLRSLDATRRWSVVLFLTFVGLHEKGQPIMSLAGTDLRGINGSGVPMDRVVNGGNVHPNGAFTP